VSSPGEPVLHNSLNFPAVRAGMLSEISRFNNTNNASQATVITKTFFLM